MRKYKSDYIKFELLRTDILNVVEQMFNVPQEKLYVYFSNKPFTLTEALCTMPLSKRLSEDFPEIVSRNLTGNESIKGFAERLFNKLQDQCSKDHKDPTPSSHNHTFIVMYGHGETAEFRGAVSMYNCMFQSNIEVVASEKVASRVPSKEK